MVLEMGILEFSSQIRNRIIFFIFKNYFTTSLRYKKNIRLRLLSSFHYTSNFLTNKSISFASISTLSSSCTGSIQGPSLGALSGS